MSDDLTLTPPRSPGRKETSRSAFFRFGDASQIVLLPIGTAIAALALWQIIVSLADVPHTILPLPSEVADQLVGHFSLLMKHAVPTTLETLLAFGISIPIAVALAAAMIWSKTVQRALYPNIVLFQLIPKVALAPMFVVWLGINAPSRVTFAVFLCFFPILIATATGLQAVNRDTLRLCRSVGASSWQILMLVRFPTAVTYIFSGMKIAVTLAVIGVVVGEFIASQAGLGYLILFASSRQLPDLGLACIVVLCAIGLMLYGLVAAGEWVMVKRFG